MLPTPTTHEVSKPSAPALLGQLFGLPGDLDLLREVAGEARGLARGDQHLERLASVERGNAGCSLHEDPMGGRGLATRELDRSAQVVDVGQQ